MPDLIAEIQKLFISDPVTTKPNSDNFKSRMAYLRASTKWYSQHSSQPKPPATNDQIQSLRNCFSGEIPELIIQLLQISNGGLKFRPEYELNSIETILETQNTFSEFDEFDSITGEAVYPQKTLKRFLCLFGIDKVDVGIFIVPSRTTAVYAIDFWDTKVCYLAHSLESYLAFMLHANRDGLYKSRSTSNPLSYSKSEKALVEQYEEKDSIYPLAKKKNKTYFSIYSGAHWPKDLVSLD